MEEPQDLVVERIMRDLLIGPQRNGNSAPINISINAGGVGVWISVTCLIAVLSVATVGAFWISRELNRVDSRFGEQADTDSVQDAYIHKLRAEQAKGQK